MMLYNFQWWMLYALLKMLCRTIYFVDLKQLSKIIVQLTLEYHCSALELYNTPIMQIYDLVELINEGYKNG